MRGLAIGLGIAQSVMAEAGWLESLVEAFETPVAEDAAPVPPLGLDVAQLQPRASPLVAEDAAAVPLLSLDSAFDAALSATASPQAATHTNKQLNIKLQFVMFWRSAMVEPALFMFSRLRVFETEAILC